MKSPADNTRVILAAGMVLATMLTMASSTLATAQEPLIVTSEPSCPACVIRVRHLLTLGTADGPGAFPSYPGPIARDSRGRFYAVTSDRSREVPFVFDSEGRFLTRLGQVGEGPGEYLNPGIVLVSPGDTIHIVDQGNFRHTVLGPSYEVVRTSQQPARVGSMLVLDNGDVVANARRSESAFIGKPLHVFDREGNLIKSFGEYLHRPNDYSRFARWLAPARRGFWTVTATHQYRVTLWDPAGNKLLELVRQADWFPPYERIEMATPTRPPNANTRGIWEDERGYVWIVGQPADLEWQRGLGEKAVSEGMEYYETLDRHLLVDGLIEVLDPSGHLVTSQRFPYAIDNVIEPGLVASIREDELGWSYADIYQVELVVP